MKSFRTLACAVLIGISGVALTGCGTTSGALIGGTAGYAIGGNTASTVGGAVVGGVVGHQMNKR